MRREGFESRQRILQGPGGVAGVIERPDILRSGFLDQHPKLAGLQVAGVILDRNLQP